MSSYPACVCEGESAETGGFLHSIFSIELDLVLELQLIFGGLVISCTFTLEEQAYMLFSNCGKVGGICSRRTVARNGGVRPGWKNDQSRTNSQL